MRCGPRRVPAPAGEGDLDLVGRGGDRADPQADLPDVEGGVAVQREDAVDPDEPVLGDDVLGPSGHDLLGGLEDEPDADPRGHETLLDGPQRECRADQGRRVHVVPARVAHTVGA